MSMCLLTAAKRLQRQWKLSVSSLLQQPQAVPSSPDSISVSMSLTTVVAMAGILLLCAGTSSAQQKALVVFNVGGNGIIGAVTFEERAADCAVAIVGSIAGLRPSAALGLHVHAYGDVSSGCNSIGGHWNPLNSTHGDLDADPSHAGDLGNIRTDDTGVAHVNLTSRLIARVGFSSLLGRTLAVHNGTDDLGLGNTSLSSLNGNSGVRLACGVIGVAIGGGGVSIPAAATSCGGATRADATTATASSQVSDAPATASSNAASVAVTSRPTEANSASQSSSGNSTATFGSSYAASAMANASSSYGGNPVSTPAASQPSLAASISWSSSASPSNTARSYGLTNSISPLSITMAVTSFWMSNTFW